MQHPICVKKEKINKLKKNKNDTVNFEMIYL